MYTVEYRRLDKLKLGKKKAPALSIWEAPNRLVVLSAELRLILYSEILATAEVVMTVEFPPIPLNILSQATHQCILPHATLVFSPSTNRLQNQHPRHVLHGSWMAFPKNDNRIPQYCGRFYSLDDPERYHPHSEAFKISYLCWLYDYTLKPRRAAERWLRPFPVAPNVLQRFTDMDAREPKSRAILGPWCIERDFANGANDDFYVRGLKGTKANSLMTCRYKKFKAVRAEGPLDHEVEVGNVFTRLQRLVDRIDRLNDALPKGWSLGV